MNDRGSTNIKQETTTENARDDGEEDQAFVIQSKARNKRRLEARWKCGTKGHSYCFIFGEHCHIQLTDQNIEEWVNTMDAGYATLVDPPESVVPLQLRRQATDVYSLATTNTISYKRPFTLFSNPSLTDIRSWRDGLADKTITSSPGNLGPGFIPGMLLTALGRKILDILSPIEIRRRLWVMGRLVKRMEKEQELKDNAGRRRWLDKKERALNRLVDDILELSTDHYSSRYQTKSVAFATSLRHYLLQLNFEDTSNDSSWSKVYWIISLRIAPIDFLRENPSIPDTLAIKLREHLLQERFDMADFDVTIAELIICACNELNYGISCASRRHAFEFLDQVSFLPVGQHVLEGLARPNGVLEGLANKLFGDPKGIEDHAEHACGVQFFVSYANDHVSYRHCILGPNGLSLIPRLGALVTDGHGKERSAINWKAFSWLCRAISSLVQSDWLIPALLDSDVCNVLCSVLMFHQEYDRPDDSVDYWIICIFCDLFHVGEEPGLRAVRESVTPEVQDQLRRLSDPAVEWGNWMKSVTSRISEILEKTSDGEKSSA